MKHIFITGVSTGIGYGLAVHFASQGHRVLGSVRKASDAEALEKQFRNFTTCVLDVSDVEATQKLSGTLSQFLSDEKLDVLINNAGIAVAGPLELITEEDFEQQLDVNIKSVRRITNVCLPFMKNKGGTKVINIGSVSGFMTTPFMGAYCISKHGLESLTDAYRRELMGFDVDVILIQPGPIKTPIWSKSGNIYDKFQTSDYAPYIPGIGKMVKKSVAEALDISEVNKAVQKAVDSKKGKTRYMVHKSKFTLYLLKNFILPRWLDSILAKAMGVKK